jgi:nicotinamide-nucleotide amidase
MPSQIVQQCVNELVKRNYKIAFAESATAGRFAAEFALVPMSGQILLGGITCYDVQVKSDLLNVPKIYIEQFSAESAQVTKALAENLRVYFKSDIILAVTGLASRGGSESADKPVGTMFLHILLRETAVAHTEVFYGAQEEIVLKTVDRGCELIIDNL